MPSDSVNGGRGVYLGWVVCNMNVPVVRFGVSLCNHSVLLNICQHLLEMTNWFVVSRAACILSAGAPNSAIAPPSQLSALVPMHKAIDSRREKDIKIIGLMHSVVGVCGWQLFQTKNRADGVIGPSWMRTHTCMYPCLSHTEHPCRVPVTTTTEEPTPKSF